MRTSSICSRVVLFFKMEPAHLDDLPQIVLMLLYICFITASRPLKGL